MLYFRFILILFFFSYILALQFNTVKPPVYQLLPAWASNTPDHVFSLLGPVILLYIGPTVASFTERKGERLLQTFFFLISCFYLYLSFSLLWKDFESNNYILKLQCLTKKCPAQCLTQNFATGNL